MREATCSCGQLRAAVDGDPIRVSVCHCLACQRRTGSAFGVQARFGADQVTIRGRSHQYVRLDDDGEPRTFHFCPDCGAIVYYGFEPQPEVVVIPVGAFADPSFPGPGREVYEHRRHRWAGVTVDDRS